MEMIFGNDGINYRVLAKTSDISDRISSEISKEYCAYTIPAKTSEYSDASHFPEAICYVSTNLKGALPYEMALIAKSAKMLQYSAGSYYTQVFLTDTSTDFYEKEFFEIFHRRFINSEEAGNCPEIIEQEHSFERWDEVDEKALDASQIRMLLMALFTKMERRQTLRIISDIGGDNYNLRSRSILASLYHYLPYDYRRRCGFASYMDAHQKGFSGVNIEVLDPTQASGASGIDIVLGTTREEDVRRRTTKKDIVEYAELLASMTDEDRDIHFHELNELFGENPLSIIALTEYMHYLNVWGNEDADINALIPEWARYVTEKGGNKGPLFSKLMQIIQGKLSVSDYQDYFMDALEKSNCDLWDLPGDIKQLFYLADEVETLEVDADRVALWYFNRMVEKNMHINTALLSRFESASVESPEFNRVKTVIVERLKIEKEKFDKAEQEKREAERRAYEARKEEERRKREEEELQRKERLGSIEERKEKELDDSFDPVTGEFRKPLHSTSFTQRMNTPERSVVFRQERSAAEELLAEGNPEIKGTSEKPMLLYLCSKSDYLNLHSYYIKNLKAFNAGSKLLPIISVNKSSKEYLLRFHEFAIFQRFLHFIEYTHLARHNEDKDTLREIFADGFPEDENKLAECLVIMIRNKLFALNQLLVLVDYLADYHPGMIDIICDEIYTAYEDEYKKMSAIFGGE